MDAGDSSYRFKPKAPGKWAMQTYDRKGRQVRVIELKPWQLLAFTTLRGAIHGFLRAFCGSGKTIVARAIAAHKILETGKRQVFCVPKNDIGNDGFANYFDLKLPLKKGRHRIVHCEAPVNFCSPRSSSKIDELIRILCQPPFKDDCPSDNRIGSFMQIVVTHQCLTLAVRKIRKSPEKFARFVANNTFWFDEGHHIKGHDESAEEIANMNHLGKFANDILARDSGAELFAMTATPYRGDYSRLFSAEQIERFTTFSLDFLKYFPTLGIEKVDIKMEEYTDMSDVVDRVTRNIGQEINKRHLVFVPPTGRKWRRNRKDVDEMFDAIYQVIMKKTGCDLETAKSRVLDLVTENTQAKNDALLRQEPKSGDKHPSRFMVVVACMKCREGSDWCPADRIHNTSMEDSPPLNFQTNGRLFRYFPGKKHVKICYYVEKFKTIASGKREFVSDRVNYILHYMLMDDLLNPIMVNIAPFIPTNKKDRRKNKGRSTLEEVFAYQYQDMKNFLLASMADVDFTEKAIDHVISQTMERYLPKGRKFTKGEKTQIRMALKAFLLRCRSSEMRSQGVDVSFIRKNGFDEVVESKSLGSNIFTCGLGIKELKRFRETVKKIHFTLEQQNAIVKGIGEMVAKQMPSKSRLDDEYLDAIKPALKEFVVIQNAYNESSNTKNFTPEGVAKIIGKSAEHIKKMIGLYNRFMPKEIKFNWKKEGLANKAICLGKVA